MTSRGTRGLIESLVADLPPVRRLPSLRGLLAVVLALWVADFIAYRLMRGPIDGSLERLTASWGVGIVVLGLGLAAFCGAIAGLAAGMPGRETLGRVTRCLALLGLGFASAIALASSVTGVDGGAGMPIHLDGLCFSKAIMMALLPGGALLVFLLMGWVQRPMSSAAIALVGAFGLGALTVHLVCPLPGARHMLIGHLGAPVVMSLLGLLPLGLLLRRFAR